MWLKEGIGSLGKLPRPLVQPLDLVEATQRVSIDRPINQYERLPSGPVANTASLVKGLAVILEMDSLGVEHLSQGVEHPEEKGS